MTRTIPMRQPADTPTGFEPLEFFAYGLPAPQGSKRAIAAGGKIRLVEMAKGHRQWRRDLAMQAVTVRGLRRDLRFPLTTAVAVTLELYCLRPGKPSRFYPRGDLDKYTRSCLDGLVAGGLLNDDTQVIELHARKSYAAVGSSCGCRVRIEERTAP